jgi:hypothetical protein
MTPRYLIKNGLFLFILVAAYATGFSQDNQYKEYVASPERKVCFILSFDQDNFAVNIPVDTGYRSQSFRRAAVVVEKGVVMANGSPLFDAQGLIFGGRTLDYGQITDLRIGREDKWTVVTFYTRPDSQSVARTRRGNRITFAENITVGKSDFVRGAIFSVIGDIDVQGEANRDVVSLFGNVTLSPGAVVRGDVATIAGALAIPKDAAVYGGVYSGTGKGIGKRHRFFRKENELNVTGAFRYNRIDGAAPYLGVKFEDTDSLLPSAWVSFGYGFASKRWRYEVGLEQALWRKRPLAIGGSIYRRLASEDDWLLSDNENLAFTLLAKEDFKDYYEGEGGSLYVKFRPITHLTFETTYRNEKTNWLEAHRNLWSLFGGDKQFDRNFGEVLEPYRQRGISELDTGTVATLTLGADYDTRSIERPYDSSAWHASGRLEWSDPSLSSDYDYRRYELGLVRYQKITRYTMLLTRFKFAGSDGYLPIFKRYFLGGLGTLYGYGQKEFMGTRYWMANAEYRVDIPRTEMAFSVFYDVGQIADDTKLNGNVEVRNSLGASVYLGDGFRMSLAKRLDRSYSDNPRFYVRLDREF